MDGLKLAEHPRDMARLAVLAGAKGGKTRAILKLAGRGAIALTASMFNLAMWVFWAMLTILGFVSSLKRATERMTERYCARRRRRRARRDREKVWAQERSAQQERPAPAVLEAAVAASAASRRPAAA
jgi:hypothetical protein